MVGPGTGIAPFRAFMEERVSTGATGKNWLFFGEVHEESTFFYKDEWFEYMKNGHLTKLTTAFSRDQKKKSMYKTELLTMEKKFGIGCRMALTFSYAVTSSIWLKMFTKP